MSSEDVSRIDDVVTADYIGYIGSRDRDLARLKLDIAAYRRASPGVTFTVEHRYARVTISPPD
jgi:hypothetical protein